MVVTFYIKRFCSETDRHNGILMPFFHLVAENIKSILPCFTSVSFKDTTNSLELLVEKRQFFSRNNQRHHISLNSQFTVVLNGIICFSVRFCNNSLLVLWMRFQVFSFASKKVQGFYSDRKILMLLLSVLFYLQNRVSDSWNFNF